MQSVTDIQHQIRISVQYVHIIHSPRRIHATLGKPIFLSRRAESRLRISSARIVSDQARMHRQVLPLFVLHLLGDLGVVLLEAVADALLRGHPLEDAAVDAAVFARREGFGGEVVDAAGEAVLDETAKGLSLSSAMPKCCRSSDSRRDEVGNLPELGRELVTYTHKLLDLALLHALLQRALLGVGQPGDKLAR